MHEYLSWMAAHTATKWCNDSADLNDLRRAFDAGAVGCTTNPPLSYLALTASPDAFAAERAALTAAGDERVAELIGIVVRPIARLLTPVFDRSAGDQGYVRAQVQPGLADDAEAMIAMGRLFASWAPNVMVKIPGTAAGVIALEELAAAGIPTTPTVNTTISQIVAVAEANERGIARARAAGIAPAPSTAAIVLGRLQDYLAAVSTERDAGVPVYDLECACIAFVKRAYRIFRDRGYAQALMPAAFRCARQVSELVGSDVVMTIHPSIQEVVATADATGAIERDPDAIEGEIDHDAVERVCAALPEFVEAYEPDALDPAHFRSYGATAMTLASFDATGWQKLRTL
ncbi:MAG: hypothetical protein EA382_13940 [Spirochaetaceae bacterium]|nr:MAG: hypothetical protein EA382_13940 [Spirochaetaceae bacterium]